MANLIASDQANNVTRIAHYFANKKGIELTKGEDVDEEQKNSVEKEELSEVKMKAKKKKKKKKKKFTTEEEQTPS